MEKLVLVALMLTVLTGWSLDESLQEIGEGIRTGVGNAEEGTKEAPARSVRLAIKQRKTLRKTPGIERITKRVSRPAIYSSYLHRQLST